MKFIYMNSKNKHCCNDVLKGECQKGWEVLKQTEANFKVSDMAIVQSQISFK